MHDITSGDIKCLLSAVSDLNEGVDTRQLSKCLLTAVSAVIPNDLTALDSFAEPETDPCVHWDNNDEMLTPEMAEVCGVVFEAAPYDNPLIVEQVHRGNRDVLMLSDFGDQAGFRRTRYFNELMRPIGFDRQISVMLDVGPDLSYSCAIQRKGKAFSERERQMLALLAPHLSNAIVLDGEREKRRQSERRFDEVLLSISCGAVALSESGTVLQISGRAGELFEKYFERNSANRRPLPGEFVRWAFGETGADLTRSIPDGTLRIKRLSHSNSGEKMFVFHEESSVGPEVYEPLGLTPRQAEVLYWIAKGKSDEVISRLLGVSRRTVEKHAQNIFVRLGVDSRSAAAAAASPLAK